MRLIEAVEESLHTFGVKVETGRVYVWGTKMRLYLTMVAGDWRGNFKAGTTTLGDVNRRLCARILRFIQTYHEELG